MSQNDANDYLCRFDTTAVHQHHNLVKMKATLLLQSNILHSNGDAVITVRCQAH